MKWFKNIGWVLIIIVGLISCEKEGFGPLTDARPDVPVTVANATEYRPGPTVVVSRASPAFSIVLEIPESSGRTIKEITKVAATSGSSAPLFGSTGLYTSGPIAGNGTNQVTFNSTLAEYASKPGNSIPANNPPINAVELAKQFYFLVTLDNDDQIITQQVRILVVP